MNTSTPTFVNATAFTRAWPARNALLAGILFFLGALLHAQGAAISGGQKHSLLIDELGNLWAWGENERGQVGTGDEIDRTVPVNLRKGEGWISIAAGLQHSLAVRDDGTLWAWGRNSEGQLGNGSTADVLEPVQIGADTDWASVAAGDHHSLARKADGSLYAWGKNTSGQVGNDSFVSKVKDPVLINAENFISIAAGSEHSLAVQSNGSLFAWGSNTFGMLGLGTDLSPKRVPELVNTDTDWVTVAAAGNSSLATREDSTLWGWGSNSAGQLGLIATTANQFLPVQVGTNSADTTAGWVAITVGGAHALGIVDDGAT